MENKELNIEITNEHYFDRIEELEDCIKLYNGDTLQFIIYSNSAVAAKDSLTLYAYDISTVFAYNSSHVYAKNSSIVYAYDVSSVYAYNYSMVYMHEFSMLYVYSSIVTIKTINHFGAIIKQVHKLKKDILVYKKLQDDKIATLKLVKGQTFQSECFGKCRTDKALVIAITNIENTKKYYDGVSVHDNNFKYVVGKNITADRYDENIDECSNGIHFFLTREKAEKYEL